ncbi:hypothetical protein AALO_G00066770 [Alosa alosa]|uniref:Uncharacterized protein n=1 Tax=Alosa alosa TaxID=278164 RepID=A0AAV6H100_9TELE|nr:hypothetical protein AALO_G00066770 [Alosa alosa]
MPQASYRRGSAPNMRSLWKYFVVRTKVVFVRSVWLMTTKAMTLSVSAGKMEKQAETQRSLQHRIQEREKKLQELRKTVETLRLCTESSGGQ